MSEANSDKYYIKRWSSGYYAVNDRGNVAVSLNKGKVQGDLYKLVQSLVEKGIEPPVLIRFNEILRDRIELLHVAFRNAIEEFDYTGGHQIAFPIKVNPQRHVVEAVLKAGRPFKVGLEVGSKPELLASLTLDTEPHSILLCNGYKDAEYISMALMSSKLGKRPMIVIEQAYELNLVLDIAEKLGVEAEIGIRMKLSNKSSGRWETSGGENAKFGLFAYEIVECMEKLKSAGKSGWLKLVHFHIGSQQTSIESIKRALNEAAKMYTEIAFQHSSLEFFDVGGGVAVDYDGSRSNTDSSMNYSIQEYARNVVSCIGDACSKANLRSPTIITESGRALVSHHSVLIAEIIDVVSETQPAKQSLSGSEHSIIETLSTMLDEISPENCREFFHDAIELKDSIVVEFIQGSITLNGRAEAEKLCRALLKKIHHIFLQLPEVPEEIEVIDRILLESYFCNFSVFQSLPDSWAISQLFPVMPLHRLNEKAEHRATLVDLTCDSDGKVDKFIGKTGYKNFLELHSYQNQPYYVGIFLVGAYQEVLGGLHNLFGDTNVVYAELDENGNWELSSLVEGDTIEEVLHYAQYNSEIMMEQLHTIIEKSIKSERITYAESAQIKRKFKQALESYTYLVV